MQLLLAKRFESPPNLWCFRDTISSWVARWSRRILDNSSERVEVHVECHLYLQARNEGSIAGGGNGVYFRPLSISCMSLISSIFSGHLPDYFPQFLRGVYAPLAPIRCGSDLMVSTACATSGRSTAKIPPLIQNWDNCLSKARLDEIVKLCL